MRKENHKRFIQGYVCCIVAIIKSHGISTSVVEAYQSGVGNLTITDLIKNGVDEYDLKVIKNNWKELYRNAAKQEGGGK